MPRIRSKQLNERVATSGVHLGGGLNRRKLEPGEVVDIPEDFEISPNDGKSLFEVIYAGGAVEITTDPVTRPLDYRNVREARLTSPTYVPRGKDDIRDIADIRERVEKELSASRRTTKPAPDVSHETDSGPADAADALPSRAGRTRRAKRRAGARKAAHGKEATT